MTHLSDDAVRRSYATFRAQIPLTEAILQGITQLDEAFFGRKGKALMLAKQVGTKELAYEVHGTTTLDRRHAVSFLSQHIEPKTRLQTDKAGIYRGIEQWWPVKHRMDVHAQWEFELTSEIEGMFGNFRTFIRRMYHHVRTEHFEEYVGEFCARFSHPEMFESPLAFLKRTLRSVPFD